MVVTFASWPWIEQISGAASQINAGSQEIRSAADDLAQRTEQQAASIEETAAALEEITTTVKDSSRRAEEAGQLVAKARIACDVFYIKNFSLLLDFQIIFKTIWMELKGGTGV